jgi:inner membrane protein
MFDKLRASPLGRVLGTGLLILSLQIPIGLISSTIDERRNTRGQAIEEVMRTWGSAQEIFGPILTVPSVHRWKDKDGQHELTTLHRFLPRSLSIRGRVETQVRRRGIFDVPLYEAKLHLEASFVVPENPEAVWKDATLSLGVGDPKAIRATSGLAWEPGPGDATLPIESGLHAAIPQAHAGAMSVAFDLTLGGSSRLTFLPAGDETAVQLESNWPDPSFDGAWLPKSSTVRADGFESRWSVLDVARNFPSRWDDAAFDAKRLAPSSFGVTFLSPVDTYRMTDRAVKYQLLFLGLTFLCFWLV